MTVSKPGLSSANGTLKNLQVTMTKQALIETIYSIEVVKVKAANQNTTHPSGA